MTQSEPPQGKSNTVLIVVVVVGVALLLVVGVIGILAALGIAGFRSYLSRAKSVEGSVELTRLSEGLARCGSVELSGGRELPDSASPVPASLAAVSGKKYMSSGADWSAPAYTCAAFSMSTPQYFQYAWTRTSPSSGTVRASADLDGDGTAEIVLERDVTCSSGACTAGIEKKRR